MTVLVQRRVLRCNFHVGRSRLRVTTCRSRDFKGSHVGRRAESIPRRNRVRNKQRVMIAKLIRTIARYTRLRAAVCSISVPGRDRRRDSRRASSTFARRPTFEIDSVENWVARDQVRHRDESREIIPLMANTGLPRIITQS